MSACVIFSLRFNPSLIKKSQVVRLDGRNDNSLCQHCKQWNFCWRKSSLQEPYEHMLCANDDISWPFSSPCMEKKTKTKTKNKTRFRNQLPNTNATIHTHRKERKQQEEKKWIKSKTSLSLEMLICFESAQWCYGRKQRPAQKVHHNMIYRHAEKKTDGINWSCIFI